MQTVLSTTSTVTAYDVAGIGWYREEVFTADSTIQTTHAAADESGYQLVQTSSHEYTLTAYGYNGNAVYSLVETRTDTYTNEQWTDDDPTAIDTLTETQSYTVSTSGIQKANADGLVVAGQTVSWASLVDLNDPVIAGTAYTQAPSGQTVSVTYDASGSKSGNGDATTSWSQQSTESTATAPDASTVTTQTFNCTTTKVDPYNVLQPQSINSTVTNGNVGTDTVVNSTAALVGSETRTYTINGTKTLCSDGTFDSTVYHETNHQINDAYTRTDNRQVTTTDNSVSGATVTNQSGVNGSVTRNRLYSFTVGNTTVHHADGTQTTNGTVSGMNNTVTTYNYTQTMSTSGSIASGGTTASFAASGSIGKSGNGTLTSMQVGIFGDGGTLITTTYDDHQTESQTWSNNSTSQHTVTHDDGAGNSGTSTGSSSAGGRGTTTSTDIINCTEVTSDVGITSAGLIIHTGSGNGSSHYDHSFASNTTSTQTGAGLTGTQATNSSSYSNGSSTFTISTNGSGIILNGGANYSESTTRTESGNYASGTATASAANSVATPSATQTTTRVSTTSSTYDESGTDSSTSTSGFSIGIDGSLSSSSSSNVTKNGTTVTTNDSYSSLEIDNDDGAGTSHYEFHDNGQSATSNGTRNVTYSSADSQNATGASSTETMTDGYADSGTYISFSYDFFEDTIDTNAGGSARYQVDSLEVDTSSSGTYSNNGSSTQTSTNGQTTGNSNSGSTSDDSSSTAKTMFGTTASTDQSTTGRTITISRDVDSSETVTSNTHAQTTLQIALFADGTVDAFGTNDSCTTVDTVYDGTSSMSRTTVDDQNPNLSTSETSTSVTDRIGSGNATTTIATTQNAYQDGTTSVVTTTDYTATSTATLFRTRRHTRFTPPAHAGPDSPVRRTSTATTKA